MAKTTVLTDEQLRYKIRMDEIVEEIKQVEAEASDIMAIAAARMADIEAAARLKASSKDSYVGMLKAELMELFKQVPCSDAITQQKVKLVSGDVIVKKAKTNIECNNKEALLRWCKVNASEYVDQKVVETPKWGELKKNLSIVDGNIMNTETGEVIELEGLEIVEVGEKLEIK